MWRLELKTTLDINPRAYIRTPDGFVTSMHQVAGSHPGDSIIVDPQRVSYVPFFNPGSNTAIRSLLRVINPNAHEVHVEIEATDDDGNLGEAEVVTFYLAANSAMQISSQTFEAPRAQDLEDFHHGHFYGQFGDGTGKWALTIRSNAPIYVMSLLATDSGHLTNLSR